MKKVMGVEFGEWNDTVFWMVEYLRSKYGPVCVYKPKRMKQLRAAYFPPARTAPAIVQTGYEGFGVFVKISPRKKGPPVAVRAYRGKSQPKRMVITDPKLPPLIDRWFRESKP